MFFSFGIFSILETIPTSWNWKLHIWNIFYCSIMNSNEFEGLENWYLIFKYRWGNSIYFWTHQSWKLKFLLKLMTKSWIHLGINLKKITLCPTCFWRKLKAYRYWKYCTNTTYFLKNVHLLLKIFNFLCNCSKTSSLTNTGSSGYHLSNYAYPETIWNRSSIISITAFISKKNCS